MNTDNGRWDIPYGFDKELLMGLTAGAKGVAGSTYNYLAPLYNRIIQAFEDGDLEEAGPLQYQSIKVVKILIRYGGGIAGGKPVMKFVGIDCGSLRAPAHNISFEEQSEYKAELKSTGFFDPKF